MCGIFGIIEKENIINDTICALKELEYRGYDSCGVAYLDSNYCIQIIKSTDTILDLESKINKEKVKATTMIAHTRWATHGCINLNNAHPHYTNNVAIVHNGIINNYVELKDKLKKYTFYSECDSEVIAKLIDFYLQKGENTLNAISKVASELNGTFAIECIVKNEPNTIYLAKRESPLFIGISASSIFASSDLSGFPNTCNKYVELKDNEICILKNHKIKIYDTNLKSVKIKFKKFDLKENKADIKDFKHYMLKEIFDIPRALKDTYNNFYNVNDIKNVDFKKFKVVHFIGCGTAFHSCCIGAHIVRLIAKVEAYSHIASEWIDNLSIPRKDNLYVFISQSGETYDTILALKKVKKYECTTLSITNTRHSTLAINSDYVIPIIAGKEVAVASTKVYNASNLACLFLANIIGNINFKLNDLKINYNEINNILSSGFAKDFAKKLINFKTIIFIGKCEDYTTAMEASLKLKEITYINSTAFASGELKHGTLSLIDENAIVVVFLTNKKYKSQILSSISEIKSRGGKIFLITNQKIDNETNADYLYKFSVDDKVNSLLYSIIPFQLISYYASINLGNNPDKPRNLAKSVTVA